MELSISSAVNFETTRLGESKLHYSLLEHFLFYLNAPRESFYIIVYLCLINLAFLFISIYIYKALNYYYNFDCQHCKHSKEEAH